MVPYSALEIGYTVTRYEEKDLSPVKGSKYRGVHLSYFRTFLPIDSKKMQTMFLGIEHEFSKIKHQFYEFVV